MAIVTAVTAERMLEIEGASIVDGEVVSSNLILTKRDGTTINAGNVRGPQGVMGPPGLDATIAPPVAFPVSAPWHPTTDPALVFYHKNPLGEVTLEGEVYATSSGGLPGSYSLIGSLPSGFRPPRSLNYIRHMSLEPDHAPAHYDLLIQADGEMRFSPLIAYPGGVSSVILYLSGIRFRSA